MAMDKHLVNIRGHLDEIASAVSQLLDEAGQKSVEIEKMAPTLVKLDRAEKDLQAKSAALVEVSAKYESVKSAYDALKQKLS